MTLLSARLFSGRRRSEALREMCPLHVSPCRRCQTGQFEVADRGSVTVELVILAPVLVILMLFVVFVGRASGATEQIRHAADEGARAASLVARPAMLGVA